VRRFFRNIAIWTFHIGFARPVLRWVVGLRYRRRNRVPRGPCLVVSNHNSHLDAAILMTLFPLRRLPRVHPVAAADYFGSTWLLRTMALLFMNGMPIERNPPKGTDPLAPLVEALQNGESLIFFPEGSRGKAGVVAPFRAGIGRLVQRFPGLLIVPVFLSGPERIWARGDVVPVPGSIDAVVGKPRTYVPDEDARAIADRVREDVLALAPPLPPPPSPPVSPVRVAVCGVDDEERRALFHQIVERLAESEATLGVSERVIEADDQGQREVSAPVSLPPGRAWLGLLARVFRTGGMFKGERFVDMVDRAQVDDALSRDSKHRFIVTDGSALVDVLAWAEADFYRGVFDASGMNHLMQYLSGQKQIPVRNWWNFVRKAPEVWLVNVFDLVRPPVPDLLVVARMPAERIMQKIRARGEELQPYENEAFIARLQEAYQQVGALLSRRRKVLLLDADLMEQRPSRIVDEVEGHCRQRVGERLTVAPPT
jgi:1-acyl-sn-glycerol-3-phosphate acyltransferase